MHLSARESAPPRALDANASRRARQPGPTLWAVASGKGGVGKSVLSSSLAIGLSATGPRALAVDLDLGGANLHSVFGCAHARYTITDVLRGRVPLEAALVDTTVPGVRLLSGARAGLDAANPHYQQKQRLLRNLRKIDVGHIVMDLGAGSAFNTLDAFLAADRRILVTTPEPTSVENSYHFLKAAFFRSLREVAREPEVRTVLESILEDARRDGASPRELVEAAARVDAAVGAKLRDRVSAFEIDLIVNRADLSNVRRDPGIELAAATRAQLGANLRLAASIQTDSAVPAAIERGVPVLQLFPGAAFSAEVRRAVERLIVGEPIPTAPPAETSPHRVAPEPAPVAPAPPMPRFDGRAPGSHLRACRVMLGLGLNQLHERTRIRQHHVDRIEREDYAQLPPEFYLQAYVRQIAQTLGLPDGERIAECMILRAREFATANGRRGPSGPAPVRGGGEPVPTATELLAAVDFEPELEGFAQPVDSGPARRQPATGTANAPKAHGAANAAKAHGAGDAPERSAETAPAVPKAGPAVSSTNATIAALLQREESVSFAEAITRLAARASEAEAARVIAGESEAGHPLARRGLPTRRRRRRRLRR